MLANLDVERSLYELDKADCEESLAAFVKQAWHVIEPGQPYVHGWHIDFICAHLESITDGVELEDGSLYNRLLVNVPPGTMKALDSNTPVLTLDGWKRHGDLAPDDFVFGPSGKPIRVIACTPEVVEESYRVVFDDGSEIVAGSGHEWAVEREYSDKSTNWHRARRPEIVTTPELRAAANSEGRYERPDRIKLCGPIWMPKRHLLIDPYLLGAWLGDGGSDAGCIYTSHQDVEHFAQFGEAKLTTDASSRGQAFYRISVPEIQSKLRVRGLLKNKHVPDEYLFARYDDRLALLQGLMDTDGCGIKTGQCTFTNKNKSLADAVAYLAASIGAKPYVSSRYTTLNGKKYGPHYKVDFRAPNGVKVFRLSRKQANVKYAQQERSGYRYVASVEPIGKRIVKCIQVEGGIYLAGHTLVPTHNSLLTNVFWPAWEWGPRNMPHMRYVCAAHKVENLSARDSRRMRQLVMSDWYQKRWGNIVTLSRDQNEKLNFTNNAQGFRIATAITGLTGQRGDRVIIDDPHSVDSAASDVQRQSEVTTFLEAASNRLNDPIRSAIVVIMQRLHEEDISGVIISKKLGYDHIMLPMRYEPGRAKPTLLEFEDPRSEEGELLFPARFPANVVDNLERDMGPYGTAGQHQQSPEPRGGGIIKRDWWVKWDKPQYPQFEYVVASLDTAYTTKAENDPSAMTVWGVWSGGDQIAQVTRRPRSDGEMQEIVDRQYREGHPKVMLMYAWAERLELHDLVERVRETMLRYGADNLLIENKAAGHSVAQELRRVYGGDDFGVQMYDPKTVDKMARLYSVQHLFADGLIHCPPKQWAEIVINQCAQFPRAKHDDLVDTVSMSLKHLRDTGILLRNQEYTAELDHSRAHRGALPPPLYPV